MARVIRIKGPTHLEGKIILPGSKSISNRVLIIQSLCAELFNIDNLSTSKDTVSLIEVLSSTDNVLDCGHAGTSYRFMTALLAFNNDGQILTGSGRMKQRPIGPLVDALKEIGANITYLEKEGYPPLQFGDPSKQLNNTLEIDASMSSQYISALMLIAPALPQGLSIHLKGEIVSSAYINMTQKLMEHFGVSSAWDEDIITIPHGNYVNKDITIEGDWSSASYLFGLAAVAESASLSIAPLFENSIQGDASVAAIATAFGVSSQFDNGTVHLSKTGESMDHFDYDFINQPDLAQGFSVVCACNGISANFSGLQTLSIKETDRIAALKNELAKVGITILSSEQKDAFSLTGKINLDQIPRFETYEDHRMAMALSQIALKCNVEIVEPDVVIKSFPNYWEVLEQLGFEITNPSSES